MQHLRSADRPTPEALARQVVHLVASAPAVRSAGVFALVPGRDRLRLIAGVGAGEPGLEVDRRHASRAFQALRSGRRLSVEGTEVDALIQGASDVYGLLLVRRHRRSVIGDAGIAFIGGIANLLSLALAGTRLEEQLRVSEERLRTLVENAPDMIFRVRLAPEPGLDYVSPALAAIAGARPEAPAGSLDRLLRLAHPDDRGRLDAALRTADTHLVPMLRLTGGDGGMLWMEPRLRPIHDASGELVAVEGALRDVTAHHRADERLAALNDVAGAILSGRDPLETLRLVAHHARTLIDADLALIVMDAPEPELMRVVVAEGAGRLRGRTFPRRGSMPTQVLEAGAGAVVRDLSGASGTPLGRLAGTASTVFAALSAQGRALGVLVAGNRPGGRVLRDPEREVVESFAHQAAIAIEQGRAREAMSRLAVLEDRTRIARELHDGVVQALFGVGMSLQGIMAGIEDERARARLTREAEAVDRVIGDLRDYIFELQPRAVTEQDLWHALILLCRRFEERYGTSVDTDIDRAAAAALGGVATQVLQIAREALSNVGRHAAATSCALRLREERGRLVLTVADDGRGLPSPGERVAGRGLTNLRRRAAELGGGMHLSSRAGRGTTLRVVLPRA